MPRHVLTFALLLSISACGSKSPVVPTAPSIPAATATRVISLSGNMVFGDVQVGSTFDAILKISNSGTSALTVTSITPPSGFIIVWSGTIPAAGAQDVILRFSPTTEQAYSGTVTVNADQTSGTNTMSASGTGTRPPGPRTSFEAGTYFIGSEIVPARYYSDPSSGCYWERLAGLGGSLNEIISNVFVSFDAGQWIVDILGSDKAFKTETACGTWFQTARRGLQADITQGMWLVGSQVSPGTYRASARSGCYWERLRDFQATFDGIIANDFVSSAGPQLVEVRASDTGFQSDDECGTWTRVSSLTPGAGEGSRLQSRSTMKLNWESARRKRARP